MYLKFWGSYCIFMDPVYVSVIRDMAVCCIYSRGVLRELTILLLVDADCLGSRGTKSGGELSQCCLTSALLDGHFLVFEGYISLEDVGGRYQEWLRLNLISCLKFWYTWDPFDIHKVVHILFSPATWCCLNLTGAVLPLTWHILYISCILAWSSIPSVPCRLWHIHRV